MLHSLKVLFLTGSLVCALMPAYAGAASPVPRENPKAALPEPRQNPNGADEGAALAAALPLVEDEGLAPEATANLGNEFTLEGFFAGRTFAKGTIFSKTVGAARSFRAVTKGMWDGEFLTLVESYQYAAGDREERVWRFRKTGANTYVAESNEILSPADVVIRDRVAEFKYQKKIPRPGGKGPVKVTFDETWTLRADGVLESRTELRKLLRVGREAINFARAGNEEALNAPGF